MISSVLQGGLGNQLFQVAAAINLAKELNTICVFSTSLHLLSLQGNKAETYRTNIFSKINFIDTNQIFNNLRIYTEPSFSYKELPKNDDIILSGYFQSEKYFSQNSEYIKTLFSECESVKLYIDQKYGSIDFINSISLHVRRGDYLRFPGIHPICKVEYYNNAISAMPDHNNILVFSDDIAWCKENLNYRNIIFIENEKDFIDLYLMSRCKYNILANSSFSWWAAWLNNNINKKVIYPKTWFGPQGPQDIEDLFPQEWIKCY